MWTHPRLRETRCCGMSGPETASALRSGRRGRMDGRRTGRSAGPDGSRSWVSLGGPDRHRRGDRPWRPCPGDRPRKGVVLARRLVLPGGHVDPADPAEDPGAEPLRRAAHASRDGQATYPSGDGSLPQGTSPRRRPAVGWRRCRGRSWRPAACSSGSPVTCRHGSGPSRRCSSGG